MAWNNEDPTASTWEFASAATSNSIRLGQNQQELVGISWPAFETNTARLYAEWSADSIATLDADATFVKVYDKDGNEVYVVVDTTGGFTKLAVDDIGVNAGRVRWHAKQSDGSTAVSQVAQVVTPRFKTV